MNSHGHAGRGARPPPARGHRPHRGGGGRGAGRGHGGRGGRGGFQAGNGRGASTGMSDPSLDPQLAPRSPHPGYFQTSFVENPWFDLERKLGIPHLKTISSNAQPQHDSVEHTQGPAEQAIDAPDQPVDAVAT